MRIIDLDIVGAGWRRWLAKVDIRTATARLERMSDAELRDIGILRDDIRRCVRQGRAG